MQVTKKELIEAIKAQPSDWRLEFDDKANQGVFVEYYENEEVNRSLLGNLTELWFWWHGYRVGATPQ